MLAQHFKALVLFASVIGVGFCWSQKFTGAKEMIREIAKALRGKVVHIGGREEVRAPGPGHSPHDDSLSVRLSPTSRSGISVHSFAGDDWRQCHRYVLDQIRGLLLTQGPRRPRPRTTDLQFRSNDGARSQRALRYWHEAGDMHGTPAEKYLARRGIAVERLPHRLNEVLRWHPRCLWGAGRHGCMLALWTDAITGAPRSIHRTALTPDGEKINRRFFGPNAGCVIRLWPDDQVEQGLVLGEGIETVLAAATRIEHRGTLLQPAWAAGDANHLEAFQVLPGINTLTLLVDADENGRGQRAAAECMRRWRDAGREVSRLVPEATDTDFADLVAP
jgi:hypothetical protein